MAASMRLAVSGEQRGVARARRACDDLLMPTSLINTTTDRAMKSQRVFQEPGIQPET
jgi:hypothetical protein